MPWVGFQASRLSVWADIPDSLAGGLRRLRHGPPRGATSVGPQDRLVIAERLPPLQVEKHDPSEAIEFLRELPEHQRSNGRVTIGTGASTDLEQRLATHLWYHTIELPGGVVTPGLFDHRPLLPHYGLPATLVGQRALDVATFDGFWAFELERRGAEVVATDVPTASALDMHPEVRARLMDEGLDRVSGDGFRLAHEALGSRVTRVERSVYDLDPDDLGTFDFVHMSDLLLHVADPLRALRGVRRVTGGRALIVDCFDRSLASGLTRYRGAWSGGVWWMPSLDTFAQMVLDAGFGDVELQLVYSLGTTKNPVGPWRAALLATP